jgi:hypothetical protein
MTHNGEELSKSIEKLVRWLKFMSVSNAVAGRAYNVIIDILMTGAPEIQIGISDIFAEEEAGIYRSHSFQTSRMPGNTTFPSRPGSSFPQGEWEIPYFNYPTATANFDTHFSTTPGE